MKIPQAVNSNSNLIVAMHRSIRAAARHLIALTLLLPALPCTLAAQTLQHEWSFNESGGLTATDSVAGANITLLGGASLGGGVLTLPGGNGNYAQLPNGILSSNNSVTIETWLTDNGGETWARAWSFGGSTTGPNNAFIQNNYIDLIPHSGPGPYWTEFNHGGVNVDAESTAQLPTGTEQYTTVTYDAPSQTIRLYLNGVQVATATGVTITPASLGFTYNNYIGLDQWNDPVFTGTFDEMRIWSGPVSQRYLSASALAGPDVVINNLTPTSASLTVGANVVVTGTEQAALYVQLPETGTNELLATSDATNWISSNTNVLLVNSSGLITGVNIGTATVSATVAGINSTSAPITVGPRALLHRYSFVSDASDSVGGANWDGTIVAPNGGSPATISNGLSLPGNTVGGFGYSGYVSLPNGILTNTTSITVETWVTQNAGDTWAEIWDFGSNDNENFALIPDPANNNNDTEVAFNPNNNDIYTASDAPFPNGSEQYVVLTYNNSTLTGNLYTNGLLEATQTYPNTSYAPGSIGGPGGTTQNMLGNDVYGDDQFNGTIYEFRIWNGAVTPVYLAASAVAGPSVVITNTAPQSLNVSVMTSMLGSQTQNAAVTGSFLQVADVPLTSAVAHWTSSDTNVLTVNGNGLITALSGGAATVSATVNGVTAISPVINVQTTAPTASLESTNLTVVQSESAEFSVQAYGGSLSFQWSFDGIPIAGATNNTLTLTNVTPADAGTYGVLITNTIGSTNLSATLAVSAPVLLHRYSFVSDASDSVGNANGSIIAPNGGSPATIADGLSLPGNPGGGYGVSG
ncbi:MAG: LamG-like jellyroll fold domain-containing protein, partial [Verrucomicrobiota bacterium]